MDYPHKNERATVSGKIVLNDPQAPKLKMGNLLVGLTAPDYTPATIPRGGGGGDLAGAAVAAAAVADGFGLAGGGEDEAAMTNQNNFASRRE